MTVKYEVAYSNRLGNRHQNEDRFGVVETPHCVFMALADGMGGHKGGNIAAQTFCETASQLFNKSNKPIKEPAKFLDDVIHIAHQDVLQIGKIQRPTIDPRTTCVICLVQDGFAWWAHVGDSRLYHIRFSKVIDQTIDHSEVEDLYRHGVISEQEKLTHPHKNRVSQCIGSPSQAPRPSHTTRVPLQRGDILLLCSDGLWSAFSNDQLAKGVRRDDLNEALDQLAHDAEAATFPNSDNISVVALRWQSSAVIDAAPLDPGGHDYDELANSLDEITKAVKDLESKR